MSAKKADNATFARPALGLDTRDSAADQRERLGVLYQRWQNGWPAPELAEQTATTPIDLQQLSELVAMLGEVAFVPAASGTAAATADEPTANTMAATSEQETLGGDELPGDTTFLAADPAHATAPETDDAVSEQLEAESTATEADPEAHSATETAPEQTIAETAGAETATETHSASDTAAAARATVTETSETTPVDHASGSAAETLESKPAAVQGELALEPAPPNDSTPTPRNAGPAGRDTIRLAPHSLHAAIAENEADLAREVAAAGPRDTLTMPALMVDPDMIMATYEAGDFETAYRLAESYLKMDSENQDMQLVLLECQDELLKQFEAQVGSLKIKPTKAREIDDEESEWGEEAGYILDRIDGSVSFEELFDRTTISTVDAYRIVTDLINQGIIAT